MINIRINPFSKINQVINLMIPYYNKDMIKIQKPKLSLISCLLNIKNSNVLKFIVGTFLKINIIIKEVQSQLR